MKETTKVNNPKKRMAIFHSLMAVEFHPENRKTRQSMLQDLQRFEQEGKLRIYYPEVHYE